MERLATEIGRALRRARRERGLTLRQVGQRSRDRFKPTSVAGYERGERSVSVERFCELSAMYGIPPDRLLADALRRWGGRPEVAIDATRVEGLRGPEARLIADFVSEILELRGEPRPESITLRAGDVEILATASGRQPQEFLDQIHDALLQALGPSDALQIRHRLGQSVDQMGPRVPPEDLGSELDVEGVPPDLPRR